MKIIIPIGGLGERFKKEGYKKPKPLIKVLGKEIIFWLLDDLTSEDVDVEIYIPYNKELEKFNFENLILNRYKKSKLKINFYSLKENTRGAAETVKIMLENIDDIDDSFLLLDSDVFYEESIINKYNGGNTIFYFEDNDNKPIYSYIQIQDEYITDIREKEKISNNANVGAYGFKNGKDLLKYINRILTQNIRDKNEYYISTIYKEMLKDNIQIKSEKIEKFICLGTPFLIKIFANYRNKDKTIRFCFDIDNTLVSYPYGDWYDSVKPLKNNINIVKKLYNEGHYIILYTARRMKTHNGNVGKIIQEIGEITLQKLKEFEIPYHEIHFGKPYADFYIDDLAINPYTDNFELETGFYNINIEPRHFNSIEYYDDTVIKKSDDLIGETYYYRNIPEKIKDLFPKLLSVDKNSITIEKIKGINISYLYSNKLLTFENFDLILKSLDIIHNVKIEDNVNIYENYSKKLTNRFDSTIFLDYEDSKYKYHIINDLLLKYEKENQGEKTVIHGDPVFSNILLCNSDKIKFLDMRGMIGDTKTISGDKFYDYAKIYQSIIGYDFILNDTEMDYNYIQTFKTHFENYITTKYNKEKMIQIKNLTNSLLLSLIPLHNNEKCKLYYKLIEV